MHDWKRFWHPINESPSLSDDGFLTDPDGEYGNLLNPSVFSWERVHDIQCLALVGEPGIGKTTALQAEVLAVKEAVEAAGDAVLSIDLGEYGEESRLIEEVFKSDAVEEWASGTHLLHLFLDGLDECRLQVPSVAKIITSQLQSRRRHLSRLRLRIACRTVDWPKLLTDSFADLFGAGSPAIFALAPLRRADIRKAAADLGVDAGRFIDDVTNAGAQSLAIKPVTLKFLLSIYKSDGRLPESQVELYEGGCKVLCAELSTARLAANQIGNLSESERLRIAELVAAVIIFSGRNYVHTDAGTLAADEDLLMSDLVGASVVANSSDFLVDQAKLAETLATGLYSSIGDGRIKFTHRTYAEFLAASYLMHQRIDPSERLKLVRHPDSIGGRIVPQLRETAAWLASMDRGMFRVIASSDPQVLLRSDTRTVSDDERVELINSLLDLARDGTLLTPYWEDHPYYHRLDHPAIANNLESIIVDGDEVDNARQFAIDLARACGVAQITESLVDVALNDTNSYSVRCSAIYAAIELTGETTLLRLKPLALASIDQDPQSRLKGAALEHLWPGGIAPEELFDSLHIPPRREYGTYAYFIADRLPASLIAESLPFALRWVSGLPPAAANGYPIREAIQEIAKTAWAHFDEPAVLAAIVKYSLKQLASNSDVVALAEESPDDERKRRELVECLVPIISDFEKEGYALIFMQPHLVRSSDVEWMVDRLLAETRPPIANHWALLIDRSLDSSRPGQLDVVLLACERSVALRKVLEPRFAPVELHSPDAAKRKSDYEKYQEWSRRDREAPQLLDPPPAARIAGALDEMDKGSAIAWVDAIHYLQLEEVSTGSNLRSEVDLTMLPGWRDADAPTRRRLIQGAANYLATESCNGAEWLGTNTIAHAARWGYKALFLLAKEDPGLFWSLPTAVWDRWAAAVMDFESHRTDDPDAALHEEIAATCILNAGETVCQLLKLAVTRDREAPGFFMPQFVRRQWGQLIGDALTETLRDTVLPPDATGAILALLLEKNSPGARDLAIEFLQLPLAPDGVNRERACAAAVAILRKANDPAWNIIRPILEADVAFGKSVFEKVAYADMHNPELAFRLKEEEAGQLYIWLEDHYPSSRDSERDNSPFVSPADAVAHYRDSVLRSLENRGTPAAVKALRQIRDAFPGKPWLAAVIAEAIRLMLRKTWRPLAPQDLIEATRRTETRLVLSSAHLQGVLIESLINLQQYLQGETPATRDIWDKVETGKYRPIDENDCSDYIKRFLQTDLRGRGIIALREVEIRRGRGETPGERTDLYVAGTVPGAVRGSHEQVRVIIEVKGSWNDEVDTGIEIQLAGRYLRETDCAHGIYVVLWFRCAQWDVDDYRLRRSRSETAAELQSRLDVQANSFSNETQVIRAVALNASLR